MFKKLFFILLLATFGITANAQTAKIYAEWSGSLLRCDDSTIKVFGYNGNGKLGISNIQPSEYKLPISSPLYDGIIDYSSVNYVHFVKSDGTVWNSGVNHHGTAGNGSGYSEFPDVTPTQIGSLNGIVAVSAATYHSLFLKNDGTVWACGDNSWGEFGDGTYNNSYVPIQIPSLSGITAVSASNHSLFLKNDGTVWASGAGHDGQLGNGNVGTYSYVSTLFQIPLSGIIAISAGKNYSLFLKNDGTVWACGSNGNGQIGLGSLSYTATPVMLPSLSGIIAIASNSNSSSSLFLKNDGTVWACGNNSVGQLGDGTNIDRHTPVQISSLSNITEIATSGVHSLFLKSDGTVWSCGENSYGQLGDGTKVSKNTPVNIGSLSTCFVPTPPQVNFSNFPSSLCVGSNVSVDPTISGSNPERAFSVDNSISLNAPKSICRNSQAVFILQDNNEILRFDFGGTLQYTYNVGAVLLDSINAITVDENNNVWADAGNNQDFFYRLTPAGTLDIALESVWTAGNAASMFFFPNGYVTDDLFVLEDSSNYTSVDVDNSNSFSNANFQGGFAPSKVSSITFDNKLYAEKRLIMADPVNSKIWSWKVTGNGTQGIKLLVDSATTANLALDFVCADSVNGLICASSKATKTLGVMYTYTQPDGTVFTTFDTIPQSSVNTQIPVGMISIPRGSMFEFWIPDRGQNKLVRASIFLYSITPALPDGLKFNTYTGRVEGTPVNSSAAQTYMVIIQNGLGIDTTYVTFGINPAANITNNLGASSGDGYQDDGLTIKYYDPNNCSRLLEIADSIGGTSPGQTHITQTTYPLVGVIANDSLIRRVNSMRADNMDSLIVNVRLLYTFEDIKIFNLTRGSALLSNDTTGGTMQMAVLQMHDKPGGGKEPIIHSPVTATWSTANQHWAVTVPVTKFSDFYGSDMSTLNTFDCSDTGADTLNIPNSYYVWNYDTLFTSGDYLDTLLNQTGCDSIASLHLTLSPLGISEVSADGQIVLFPNPNQGVFTIGVNGDAVNPKSVRITNVIGNEVYSKTISGTTSVDISSLESGIYFVIIETEDKPYVQRIVKE